MLTDAERALLHREPAAAGRPADVPLLDEAAELLGEDDRDRRGPRGDRIRRLQREYAEGVLEIAVGAPARSTSRTRPTAARSSA